MMISSKWICLLLVFPNVYASNSTSGPIIQSVRSDDGSTGNAAIDNGLKAGFEIANAIGENNFQSMIGKLLTNVGPFLEATGPIVDLISSLINLGEESAELKFMREMLAKIENRFYQIDDRFDGIARQIEWSTSRTQLFIYEQKILLMKIKLEDIYNSTNKNEYSNSRESFITAYHTSYAGSAILLNHNIVGSCYLFSENLLNVVLKGTNYDRRAIQVFMVGLTKLILVGTQIDMMYYKLTSPSSLINRKQDWGTRIEDMEQKMRRANEQFDNPYFYQSLAKNDSLKILRNNRGATHAHVADLVYNKLTEKYFWLKWLVVIYDDVTGFEHSNVRIPFQFDPALLSFCHGFNVMENDSILFVASANKTSPSFSVASADNLLASVNRTLWPGQIQASISHNIDCVRYSAFAVIMEIGEPVVRAPPSRFRKHEYLFTYGFKNTLIIFG